MGSKKKVIDEFAKKKLKEYNILEIEGYNTEVTFNQVIKVILSKVFKVKAKASNSLKISTNLKKKILEQILDKKNEKNFPSTKLVLIIHNIEGANLRGETQELLSYLGDHPAFKIIATFDHVKTPSMWNSQIASRFNFFYYNLNTMIPYKEEMKFEETQEFAQDEHNAFLRVKKIFEQSVPNFNKAYFVIARYCINGSGLSIGKWQDKIHQCGFNISYSLLLKHIGEYLNYALLKRSDKHYTIPFESETIEKIISFLEDFLKLNKKVN